MLKANLGLMMSGKSMHLIQAKEVYERKGFRTIVLKSKIDTRENYDEDGWGMISSRFAPNKKVACHYFDNLKDDVIRYMNKCDVFLIDEAQFLKKEDIELLKSLSTNGSKEILCYALPIDVNGNTFEGSQALLDLADEVTEIPMLCQDGQCLEKATHHARYINGVRDTDASAVKIEKGNVTYKALCYKHWKER